MWERQIKFYSLFLKIYSGWFLPWLNVQKNRLFLYNFAQHIWIGPFHSKVLLFWNLILLFDFIWVCGIILVTNSYFLFLFYVRMFLLTCSNVKWVWRSKIFEKFYVLLCALKLILLFLKLQIFRAKMVQIRLYFPSFYIYLTV